MKFPALPILGGLAIACASFIGGCLYKAHSQEAITEVKCSSIEGGRDCLINVKNKSIPDARVCWEMHSVCKNGNKSMAKKCVRSTLTPGVEIRALVANQEFSNYEICDQITASGLESLYVIGDFTRIEFPETPTPQK
ncbi:hypothetical protein [Oryzisolibacter sp. LB2S]|uniref:hypothetical protein n=1 Tax=Alicycliphilus soli TaxID=3228789 RepID=UPI0034584E68